MDLNQITLPCTDYDESVAFYSGLELTLIVDSPPRYARFETSSGTTLSIHECSPAQASSGTVVYFEVDDVDARVAELKNDGYIFDSGPVDEPWLWREARLRDPAGNPICIFHAGDNRRNPPWRIKDK